MRSPMRVVLLVILLAAAVVAMVYVNREPDPSFDRLTYVTTAHQLGVVGYRDPVGAISADGRRMAFAEGRRLFEILTTGGARVELMAGEGQIRHVGPLGSSGEWIFEDGASPHRWWAVAAGSPARPLFGDRQTLDGQSDGTPVSVRVNALRQLSASADGRWLAAVTTGASGPQVWRIAADSTTADVAALAQPAAAPAWTAAGELACTVNVEGRWRLSVPCGSAPVTFSPDVEVIGPLAFAPDGRQVYFASPNPGGTVDLWSADLDAGQARQLSAFARDTYAPSMAADGRVLFKTQSYRTSVAELDLESGTLAQLSTLQAETPSYSPDGRRVAVTYGTWRRVIDDAKYPDIAQEIGILPSMPAAGPVDAPLEVIADSDSEDQAMTWSPNGKWIVLHSHREQSDDIWLRPADGRVPDRRLSFLGRGAEVGWPRWSPDGRLVLYDGASPSSGRSVMFVIGIDQESGAETEASREVAVSGFEGEITHGEWLPDSATIIGVGKEGPGRHALVSVPVRGGPARVIHRFASEHDFPGHAVSPDGTTVAFIAPAPDGFYQVFRLPVGGGTPVQVTVDRAHKTQPAWSPDGRRLAFTIWSYEAQFWLMAR